MAPVVQPVTEPLQLGEGPHWDQEEQVLYFVSIFDHTINKYVPETGRHTKSKFDIMASFIIPVEGKQNHFVVGLGHQIVEIEWTGEDNGARVLRTVAEVDLDDPTVRFNDGKADPRGRLFAGTMGYDLETKQFVLKRGSLYRINPGSTAAKLASDIDLSNGLCWDPQEKAFYYIDSYEYVIRRYDYDVETGNISNLKVAFNYKEHGLSGIADGMTIDTDGNLWVATYGGEQILKIDPRTGTILQKVPIPALQVTSATFGGPALDVLYVTTAGMGRDQAQGQTPVEGAVFTVTGLGVRGHPNVKVKLD